MDSEQAPAIREENLTPSFRFIGESIGELFVALAKAQADFAPMARDSSVSFSNRTFHYASLAEVLDSVRPALNKHGIALLQPFDGNEVVTILAFGAARLEVSVVLPDWKGDVQKLGSVLTYIKRYQLKSILGVNDGEDDDGNLAADTGKAPSPRERATPPATRQASKDAPGPAQGAVTAETKARVKELAQQAGLSMAELEAFSLKNSLGALGGLSELNGLVLVTRLEGLKVSS